MTRDRLASLAIAAARAHGIAVSEVLSVKSLEPKSFAEVFPDAATGLWMVKLRITPSVMPRRHISDERIPDEIIDMMTEEAARDDVIAVAVAGNGATRIP